jgi:hypothetical protein
MDTLMPEDEIITLHRNVDNQSPRDVAQHSRQTENSRSKKSLLERFQTLCIILQMQGNIFRGSQHLS